MKDIKTLSDLIRQTAYDIHVYHAHGHLEKVYENALAHRLRKAGLEVNQQYGINVYDEDGTLIGEYAADLLVEGVLIVELKAVKALAPEHEAQVLGYLKSSRVEHGLLINSALTNSKYASSPGRSNCKERPGNPLFPSSLRSLRSLRFNFGSAVICSVSPSVPARGVLVARSRCQSPCVSRSHPGFRRWPLS
jgi:GxxExxY protein